MENYYGRMLSLFGIMRRVFDYEHKLYDPIFIICSCLTNYNLMKKPLRDEDRHFYYQWKEEREIKREERKKKREVCWKRHNEKLEAIKKARLM